MKCKQHPRYAGKRMPKKTVGYPDGCPSCWGVWERAKTDPKRLAPAVNVELTPQEARVLIISLDLLLSKGGKVAAEVGRVVRPFCNTLAQALRGGS